MDFNLDEEFSNANSKLDRLKEKQKRIKYGIYNKNGGILKIGAQTGTNYLPAID